MAKVYVSITGSYSRTVWDAVTAYSVGDRVSYDSGSSNKIYVCIDSHTSSVPQPAGDQYWAPAGSEEYPFLVEGNLGNTMPSGVFVAALGEWYLERKFDPQDPAYGPSGGSIGGATAINFAAEAADADGTARHFVADDGHYFFIAPNSSGKLALNGTIEAKNKHGAFFDFHGIGTDTPFGPVTSTFINLKIGTDAGNWFTATTTSTYVYKGCMLCDYDYGGVASGGKTARATATNSPALFRCWDSGTNTIQATDCLFDIVKTKMDYVTYSSTSSSFFKNCTFNIALSYNAYAGKLCAGQTSVEKCIFYIDTFWKNTGSVSTAFGASQSAKDTCVHVANFVDAAGSPDPSTQWSLGVTDQSSVTTVDPLFVDPVGGNMQLRPSSPLIGDIGAASKEAILEGKYPNCKWFDSHAAGGGDGSRETPYNTISEAMTAASDEGVIAIKNGTHTQSSSIIPSKSLTFVGESISAILDFNTANEIFVLSGTSYYLKIESLKILHTGSAQGTGGLIKPGSGDITINASILERDTKTAWFVGATGDVNESSLYINSSRITGRQSVNYGFITGNPSFKPFQSISIKNCTILHYPNSSSIKIFSGDPPGGGLATKIFENNIVVGVNPTRQDSILHFTPTSYTNNCFYLTNESSGGTGNLFNTDPLFVDLADEDYRLRPSSPLIGGVTSSPPFPNGSIWVINTAGTGGTGTEEDPYYFGSLDQAYTDAGSFGSVVFKNGTYDVSAVGQQWFTFNSDTQANNVNYYAETTGGVEFIAEKIIFGHSGLNVTQSLNYTGLKITSTNATVDNFVFDQSVGNSIAAHVFSSCQLQTNHSFLESNGMATNPGKVIFKSSRLSKVSATNYDYLFEQRNGNTSPNDFLFENCIIENFLSTSGGPTKIFRRVNVTLKNTIIIDYSNNATSLAIDPAAVNLANSNCITRADGTDLYPNESNIAADPLFVSPVAGNWNLRPLSPLIGQG